MLELTAQSIKDYQVCSLYYDFRYNQQMPAPTSGDQLLAEKFQNTIHRVLSYYFFRRQGSLSVSLNALINRWERLWFPKDMDAYDLAVDQQGRNNLAAYATTAAAMLTKFYGDFQDDKGFPLLIDEKFSVPASKTLKLAGSFDLVLRDDNHHRIIKWYTGRRSPSLSQYMFEFAILKQAWMYRQNPLRGGSFSLYLYDLNSAGAIPVAMPPNTTNALDFWARSIEGNEVFIPRRPYTVYCRGCPFDAECRAFQYPGPDEYSDQK